MAYEKQTWVTGETITEEKLNHMEDGIEAAGGSAITIEFEEGQMTPTMEQVETAFKAGIPVIVHENSEWGNDYYLVVYFDDTNENIGTYSNRYAYSEESGWYIPD